MSKLQQNYHKIIKMIQKFNTIQIPIQIIMRWSLPLPVVLYQLLPYWY